MHSGETHSAFITLSSEECATAGVKLNVTIVGTEYSKLNVNVEDISSRHAVSIVMSVLHR